MRCLISGEKYSLSSVFHGPGIHWTTCVDLDRKETLYLEVIKAAASVVISDCKIHEAASADVPAEIHFIFAEEIYAPCGMLIFLNLHPIFCCPSRVVMANFSPIGLTAPLSWCSSASSFALLTSLLSSPDHFVTEEVIHHSDKPEVFHSA